MTQRMCIITILSSTSFIKKNVRRKLLQHGYMTENYRRVACGVAVLMF